MKIKNVENKLIKIGAKKIEQLATLTTYMLNNVRIKIHNNCNEDECLFVVVQSKNDIDQCNILEDYHQGAYCYTIKRTIESVLNKQK